VRDRAVILFLAQSSLQKSEANSLDGGVKYAEVNENLRFSIEIAVYIENRTR